MPPKHRDTKGSEQPDHSSDSQKKDFWDTETGIQGYDAAEEKKRLSEQISRLQQRQMELVEHTSRELEALKQQVENGQQMDELVRRAKEPLVAELNRMKEALQAMESEKKQLRDELARLQHVYRAHHGQMQGTLDSLKNIIRGQARTFDQQVRVFSLDANQSIESMLNSIETAQMPALDEATVPEIPIAPAPVFEPLPEARVETVTELPQPAPQPVSFAIHEEKLKKEKEVKEKKPRRPFSARRFAVRAVTMGIIAAAGYWGYGVIQKQQQASVASVLTDAKGQVAGASTAAQNAVPTPDQYLESQVDLPFAATEWGTVSDADFGVNFDFPKNVTNRVRSDTNLYIIRKDSYLLKVTRLDTPSDLDTWWNNNKGNVVTDNMTASKSTFKGQPAWIAKATKPDINSGTIYVVKKGTQIIEVTVKDQPATTDDQQRLARMMDSFQFAK